MPSQPYPDEGTWWAQVADPRIAATYAEAGLPYPDNPGAFRWGNRTSYDIAAGLTKEQSLDKHIAELRAELGLPSTPPNPNPPPANFAGRLRSEGIALVGLNGQIVDTLFATNFAALIRTEDEQNDYLDWLDEEGRNGSRVGGSCSLLFDLPPEVARERLPAYLDKCYKRAKYVQVPALLDTAIRSFDYQFHLDWLLELQLQWDNLIIEGANEARHQTQNPAILPIIKRGPLHGLYASSSPLDVDDENPEFAQFGNYFEIHANRSDAEDGWKWVRHTKEIWNMMTGVGTSHPGVGKQGRNGEPRRDDLREDRHFALGALCRICGIGDTLHYADGRYGYRPLDSSTQIAMRARSRYRSFIPDSFRGQFFNAGWTGSPIKSFTNANRIYSMRNGKIAFSIVIDDQSWTSQNPTAPPTIEYGDGFRFVDMLRVGRATLLRLEQA
jgi:hypothetical protein